jgi:hypothetical protein
VRNYAVKLALLAAHAQGDERSNPQAFLDLEPEAMLKQYQQILGQERWGVVMFAFSEKAILDILDEEFEVDVDRNGLMFRKTFLDAQSIRLAGGGRASSEGRPFTSAEQGLIRDLSLWLLDATRALYRGDLGEKRTMDIKQEYAENFRVYALKCIVDYEPGAAEPLLRSLFASLKSMLAFCHSLTVDALFKADAAKVIFGEQSGYHQAWLRKQIFRHMMSKAVEEYISACLI